MLRLGLAQWHHRDWANQIGGRGLAAYAEQFKTVEAGSTFYALPSLQTVAQWSLDTPSDFRFAFKFPQEVTHRGGLVANSRAQNEFFRILDVVLDRCAPFMIQLPPTFSRAQFASLEPFLLGLPVGLNYGIEFRHPDFFDRGDTERATNQLLYRLGIERIWFDTRALRELAADNDITQDAQSKKPNVPTYGYALTDTPMVRVISHTYWQGAKVCVTQWAQRFAQWVDEGRDVYCFAHTPSNARAPEFAGAIQDLSAKYSDQIPPWQWRSGTTGNLL
ncbi:DUF72 domain-containing protein [Umboniibacter marinipuniceus]|uniref:Uncharacterized protein YecE (DUF72 family) n=1 Tax=Umboniibacter marinipuniceus TaxID=569599 RepID=A0A3M0A7I0_9GAMM|nr:DUF72 domain-containing protein [Umboniibacter marinipuniceus]RMA79499.1 uncharacterized protein YecE (DUF72 family) [Umboniibacter marinipuniceus]